MNVLRRSAGLLTAAFLFSLFIGSPAPVRAEYEYNFRGCTGYTNDELAYFGGPYLQVFTPEFNGRALSWLEPTTNYETDPGSWVVSPSIAWVSANVRFTQAGQYVLIMEYTPFVYDVEYRNITSPQTIYFLFVPYAVPLQDATIQVVDKDGRAVPADVEVQFPSWDPDVDPFDAATDARGQVDLECLSRARATFPEKEYDPFPNLVNVFIDDPTYGSFCNWVAIPTSGKTIQVQVKPRGCSPTTLGARLPSFGTHR